MEASAVDARGELFLPGQKTKTKKDRRIPISARLRSIFEMRRSGADGKEHPAEAYVFGDPATGQRVRSFRRAWEAAILRAHGIKPAYVVKVKGDRKIWTSTLTPESRAELRRINLHFHDLRREAGSRWLDSGVVPLTAIRDWLGHSNISQTSTYLECQVHGQNDLMRRFEERQAALQKLANAGGTSGNKRARTGSDAGETDVKIRRKTSGAMMGLRLGVRGSWVRIPPSRPIFKRVLWLGRSDRFHS